MFWEDEIHLSSCDIYVLDKEFKKRLYKDDPALQIIREALNNQTARCEVCKGPATREALEYRPSFCDEHGLHDLIRLSEESDIHYRDLSHADWIRKAVALLKEHDENS